MKIVRISARNKQRFRSLFTQLRGEGSLLKSHFWMKILKIMKIQIYASKMNGNWKKFVA